jgi:hypothetical protein
MSMKFVSLFTLIAFIVFSVSCYTTSLESRRVGIPPQNLKGKEQAIVGAQTTSGEYIEFSNRYPVEIHQDSIKGYKKSSVIIDQGDVKDVIKDSNRISEIETKDGKRYLVHSLKDDKYYCWEPVSIPLSSVSLVWIEKLELVEKKNPAFSGGVLLASAFLVGIIAIVAISAITNKPEPKPTTSGQSCPFIYSFDGEKYIFDAEPYGGAICQKLKRTEWCGLESLKEVNGQYKVMVTNEMNETQYTDELKLVVVDHPQGVRVIPDVSGKIHTISNPAPPLKAYDSKGNDLLPFIAKNDRVFWLSRVEERNPQRKEDLRDELVFEFAKPSGAKKAKLVINACNTLWGSQSLKRYLDLYGDKVDEWYEEAKNSGPAYHKIMNTHFREELYTLQIRAETGDGWKSKGMIIGGGPFISEDKVYALDLSDVPGDVLKIKLTPPANFWMLNYLAVDYGEDLPVKVTEIEAKEAVDQKGQDVREILANVDNHYLVMPNIGDSAQLVFEAPPPLAGLDRSPILKASGYYDIHLERGGKPQLDTLQRLENEPGYAVRYAFKEYLKWKEEVMKKISQQ